MNIGKRRYAGTHKGDQRILGDTSFVLSILDQADQLLERGFSLKLRGIDLESVAKKAAKIFRNEPQEIFIKSRINDELMPEPCIAIGPSMNSVYR